MMKLTCHSTGISFEHLRESQQPTGAFPIEIFATKRWFPHISPASLDQKIITGLLKLLMLGPGTHTVCFCKNARGSTESPGCAHSTHRCELPWGQSIQVPTEAVLVSSAGPGPALCLPACGCSPVSQPNCLSEAQMMQALRRLAFVPMKCRNLHCFNKYLLSIYSAPGAIPGTGFITLGDYLLNSHYALGTGLVCHSLKRGPGLVKGPFVISDIPLFSQLRRAGRTRQGSWPL